MMAKWITYHALAFFVGFVLDAIIGDPIWLPHPVRLIGNAISCIERWLIGSADKNSGEQSAEKRSQEHPQRLIFKGLVLTISVCLFSIVFSTTLTVGAYLLHPYLGIAVEAILTFFALALKSLKTESMRVANSLETDGLEAAKKSLSMIVGRDTAPLDEAGVIRAAVETVAENASDGIIAPMLYLAIGGPALGWFYKAINTMDSMVGYKNERYLYFGRCAAKLDDFVNYIPSRISGFLISIAAIFSGTIFSAKDAFKIWRRDSRNHKSPNSAQGEAAAAGALGIQLGGGAFYFGEWVEKPTIGDATRPISREDISLCNRLIRNACILWWGLLCMGLFVAAIMFYL